MRKLVLAAAVTLAAAPIAAPIAAQTVRSISASDKAQGAQAHPQLLKEFGGAYAGPQAAYVDRVGKRIALQSGLGTGSDFTVTLLDSPIENAFAIPGGYVYVTRQLLALMNSEAELASVMGHEVGHVAARHAAGRQTRSTIGQLLAAGAGALTGSDLAGRIVGTGAQFYTLKYGRDQEYQADALGVRYLSGANYDPYAAADMLAALDASTTLSASVANRTGARVPTWMSTHPNGADRVRRARQLAAATGRQPAPEVQDTTFLRMLDGLRYDGGTGANALPAKTLRIVTVRAGDTVASLAQRMAYTTNQRERFIVLNGLDPSNPTVTPGMLVKVIV
jgi:predicted Zn-dependent protease